MAYSDSKINELLHNFSPSETALLEWLKPRVDDSILWKIAQADYGYNAHKNMPMLISIRNDLQILFPMDFDIQEVLELIRWSEPEDPNWQPGSHGERGHILRLFACAALIMAGNDPAMRDRFSTENSTLIQLVASALLLGAEATQHALALLCWRMLNTASEAELIYGEYPFFAMAVLLLRTALCKPEEEPSELVQLAEWVIVEEARVRESGMPMTESDAWLLGLTSFDSNHAAWKKVTREVLLNPSKNIPEPAASALHEITRRTAPLGTE